MVQRRGEAGNCRSSDDKEDQADVVWRSGDMKAVRVPSQARRRVIVVRRNDLEEGDRVVRKVLVIVDMDVSKLRH